MDAGTLTIWEFLGPQASSEPRRRRPATAFNAADSISWLHLVSQFAGHLFHYFLDFRENGSEATIERNILELGLTHLRTAAARVLFVPRAEKKNDAQSFRVAHKGAASVRHQMYFSAAISPKTWWSRQLLRLPLQVMPAVVCASGNATN